MSIGPHGSGLRGISMKYPNVKGIILETTTQENRVVVIIPKKSLVLQRDMVGLND